MQPALPSSSDRSRKAWSTMSEEVTAANTQMAEQQAAATEQMTELGNGLGESADGIDEIQNGLEEVQTLLDDISTNAAVDQTGIHIPQEFIDSDEIQDAAETNMHSVTM